MLRSDLYPNDTGFTPWITSRSDPRFSFALYVPYSALKRAKSSLLVVVHGTSRRDYFREGFRNFSERTGTVIFVPMFPVGAGGKDDFHGYKWIKSYSIRFDLLLLDMIEQASDIWPIETRCFFLFGFSGGGQFAHRFAYLHPERLSALSIGAPGNVTLPDTVKPWPAGVKDMESKFGIPLDIGALQSIPIQLIVGEADIEIWEIAKTPNDAVYIKGINDEQTNRIQRLKHLQYALSALGVSTKFDKIANVAHDGPEILPGVCRWLDRQLTGAMPE